DSIQKKILSEGAIRYEVALDRITTEVEVDTCAQPRFPRGCGLFRSAFVFLLVILTAVSVFAATKRETRTPSSKHNSGFADNGDYDGRMISTVEVVFEGSAADEAVQAEFLVMLKVGPNTEYSAVRVRDSLQALFDSGRVASARVEVVEVSGRQGPLRVRFIVQRQVVVAEIRLIVGPVVGAPISEDEIRARLNLIRPGTRVSRQSVLRNIDEIQGYLRDRGYFNATVDFSQQVESTGLQATVTYRIVPNEPSRIGLFNIDIAGFDTKTVRPTLALQPNTPFTRQALTDDVNRIRQAIIAEGYLAPQLSDTRVERDLEKNQITISLTGVIGPKVNVSVENYNVGEKTARDLLPIKREGNIDQSAIVEG